MYHSDALPYFPADELRCQGSGIIRIDYRAAAALPYLRLTWAEPVYLSSACRSPEHNKAVGGHPRSMHLTENPYHATDGCMAFDCRWRAYTALKQLAFARHAYSQGWSVGLHDGFCHIDRRADLGLVQRVFLYGTWTGTFTAEDVTRGQKPPETHSAKHD